MYQLIEATSRSPGSACQGSDGWVSGNESR